MRLPTYVSRDRGPSNDKRRGDDQHPLLLETLWQKRLQTYRIVDRVTSEVEADDGDKEPQPRPGGAESVGGASGRDCYAVATTIGPGMKITDLRLERLVGYVDAPEGFQAERLSRPIDVYPEHNAERALEWAAQ